MSLSRDRHARSLHSGHGSPVRAGPRDAGHARDAGAAEPRARHPGIQPPRAGAGAAQPTCRCWSACATSASSRPTWTSSSRCASPTPGSGACRPRHSASRRDLPSVAAEAHALIDEQYAVFNDELMPLLRNEGIVILNHAERNEAQRDWVPLLPARGAAAAGAGGAGPVAPVPAGGQQVAELHRAAGRQGCLRPRERHRHRQGAARAAARDPAARRAGAGQAGLRAADQRDPRPPGRAVSGPRGRGVLAVPRDARLRPGGRRGRRAQPAPGAAHGADARATSARRSGSRW